MPKGKKPTTRRGAAGKPLGKAKSRKPSTKKSGAKPGPGHNKPPPDHVPPPPLSVPFAAWMEPRKGFEHISCRKLWLVMWRKAHEPARHPVGFPFRSCDCSDLLWLDRCRAKLVGLGPDHGVSPGVGSRPFLRAASRWSATLSHAPAINSMAYLSFGFDSFAASSRLDWANFRYSATVFMARYPRVRLAPPFKTVNCQKT
jgi:hypothetical protein